MSNASPLSPPPKITVAHLTRRAVVYVRQSSPKQVLEHPESQRNQRALVHRAVTLGWHPDRVQVIDADLGLSAAHQGNRDAFKALVADLALGHIGILFGFDVSRLARNNAEWYHLLDVAALWGTLIADVEGVYDPRMYNDRLLLGLKGTMSEAELHLMRQRLTAGRQSKVARGDYVQHLPTGLVRLADGRVVKDPDDQVRQALDLLFATFARLGSGAKVLRFLKEQQLLLPRRQIHGMRKGELLWKPPSASAIYEILSNPAYAGAFVYGRRPTDPTRRVVGRPTTGTVRRPREEWPSLTLDAYPAYLSWEQYLANQEKMQENARQYAALTGRGRGAPGRGPALLTGLMTCGECGHRMRVAYKGGVRYLCDSQSQEFALPMCQSLAGGGIEEAVVLAFFEAIQPVQLDALEAVLSREKEQRAQLERHWEGELQRARYEVGLAKRRYEAVDPQNRRVAAQLEGGWEEALRALGQTEEARARFQRETAAPRVPEELRRQLESMARALPEMWRSGRLSNEQKKELLRSLIARVMVRRRAKDRVEVKIVWVSGHVSEREVRAAIERMSEVSGYEEMVARVGELYGQGVMDAEIAARLGGEGFHSARSERVAETAVQKIRLSHGWYRRLPAGKGEGEERGVSAENGSPKGREKSKRT